MSEEFKKDYSSFFEKVKKFKEKQNKQKQRGLNDYNLLTTVLSVDDEVRLHSRMLHSLLRPDGLHYQGSLFLELFLDIIDFRDKSFEIEEARVEREYMGVIDLYITDEKKHIIIENKIHACDQESQIKRYIELIIENGEKEDNNKVLPEDITVIYLSIAEDGPSKKSLGKIDEDSKEYFTLSKNSKKLDYTGYHKDLIGCALDFKSVHYKTDILEWLNTCQYEVQNITNLNEAIRQYIEVVHEISGTTVQKTTQLKDFLGEKDVYHIASEIYRLVSKGKIDSIEHSELAEEVHAEFLRTLDEKYKFLGENIGQSLSAKLDKNEVNGIKKIAPFILNTSQKQYANDHYLDLFLENGIRIQLQYKKKDENYFKLDRINVYQGTYRKKIEEKHYPISIDFNINDFYKLLTNEEDMKKICQEHAENPKLIEQLKEAIEYGNNIENLCKEEK